MTAGVLAWIDEALAIDESEGCYSDETMAEGHAVRAAVAELIEAAGLRVDWTNGTWYVLTADGAAFTNVGHATEREAQAEAAEALRAALAAVGGAK